MRENLVLGFIGFGEVAYHFSKGLLESGVEKIFAYDSANESTGYGELIANRAKEINVTLVKDLKQLADKTDIIISAVHGNVAQKVAEDILPFLKMGMLYADLNNTSPSTKRNVSEIISKTGAKFIDLELFETPARAKHKSFLMASGDGAKEFIDTMKKFDMSIELVEGNPERACEIKTLANIYFKGIQALSLEIAVAALKAGINLDLIAPLIVKPVLNIPPEKQLPFWIVRGALHAGRKTAELKDINQAMRDWGAEALMMDATKKRLNLFAEIDIKENMGPDISTDDCNLIIEKAKQISQQKGLKFE